MAGQGQRFMASLVFYIGNMGYLKKNVCVKETKSDWRKKNPLCSAVLTNQRDDVKLI